MKIRALGYRNKMLGISLTVLTLITVLEIGDGYQARTQGGKEKQIQNSKRFSKFYTSRIIVIIL